MQQCLNKMKQQLLGVKSNCSLVLSVIKVCNISLYETERQFRSRAASGRKLSLSLVVLARMLCSWLPKVSGGGLGGGSNSSHVG